MNNCALLDYNPPAPNCVTHVTPNRQLDQAIFDQGLREMEQLLQAQGGKTLEDFELPIPAKLAAPGDAAVSEERARYNVTRQAQQLARDVLLLNQHQRSIYDNVIGAVHDPRLLDKTFFVDGLGGAGKTFLYGCLLSKVRSTGDITLLMASSDIATLLLEGGCTAHSRFKIPVAGLCGSSACYVPLNSPQAALIRAARLIVWDEAPMGHKHVFEVVNHTLQHVMGVVDPALKDMFFGGKVVVMGGDFRQILPVVPRGRRGQIVDANLKRSAILWHHVKVCELHENMRVQRLLAEGGANVTADAQQQQAWADYL
jgi:ATP-dependent DNA helicase PIF1